MPLKPSERPCYTQDQLEQYFRHIQLPQADYTSRDELQSHTPDAKLSFLAQLTRHQLCKVPFENLDLHYATVKGVSLDSDHLFHKVVERNAGRGGYCMQNNSFYGTVLRSLGYNVMSAGARVSKALDEMTAGKDPTGDPAFGGYGHQVNIITIDNKKYFVDVGFGSMGPTKPVPLVDGYTTMHAGTEDNVASTLRLTRGFAANNTSRNPEQELWIYSVKFSHADDDSRPWVPCYCFSETEFFPADFNVMNHWVTTNRASIFVQMIICMKFIMSDDGQTLIGDITLNNAEIKERRFGRSTKLMDIKSEEHRIEALEKYFGIKLSAPERAGIIGFPTEIR
ncbi:hypothetical protein LTR05_002141 [Lithohypha guttulata]|uniref:Arylamine N-acetyltransferase n=1 Tax=Lithohypha guttulata TaxID=1690604 RepID=A0AAN7Y7U5_9EURO|nr:hypothetical protein LTR05_002141 [Lithohypha guttulata]